MDSPRSQWFSNDRAILGLKERQNMGVHSVSVEGSMQTVGEDLEEC